MSKTFVRRLRPSPAMVVAFVALLVALGGTSYAAVKLAANSVQTKHIKNSAVTGAKVKANTITGADVNEATLAGIKSAEAQRAIRAVGIEKVTIKSAPFALAVAPQTPCPGTPPGSCFLPVTQFTVGNVGCDAGEIAIAGGAHVDDFQTNHVSDSYPTGGTGWAATAGNDDVLRPHGFTVYAICVPGTAVGG
jgi:hypothetical protein